MVRYQIKKVIGSGDPEPAGEADLIEAVFLNLGPEQEGKDAKPKIPDVLRMLDTVFSTHLDTEEKKRILETEFRIPMTKEVVSDYGSDGAIEVRL